MKVRFPRDMCSDFLGTCGPICSANMPRFPREICGHFFANVPFFSWIWRKSRSCGCPFFPISRFVPDIIKNPESPGAPIFVHVPSIWLSRFSGLAGNSNCQRFFQSSSFFDYYRFGRIINVWPEIQRPPNFSNVPFCWLLTFFLSNLKNLWCDVLCQNLKIFD